MSTATAVENPYAGQGSVLLDIGDDVGAVVVVMPADLEGVEVEIRPEGSHQHSHGQHRHHHPHVAVVNRPVAGGRLPSLVFGEVKQGRYGLCLKESDEVALEVDVVGGEVTSATWPGA